MKEDDLASIGFIQTTFQSSLDDLAGMLRRSGVRRVVFSNPFDVCGVALQELELTDTIPAPPPSEEESLELPEEPKPAGICKYANCGEPANSGVARGYCRPHGLKMCGVGHV